MPTMDDSQTDRPAVQFVHWQDGRYWVGYLAEFPDYWTQGESLEELREHLKDLDLDLTGGGGKP